MFLNASQILILPDNIQFFQIEENKIIETLNFILKYEIVISQL